MTMLLRDFKQAVYYDGTENLDVLLDAEGVWLNVYQIAQLFRKTRQTISEHITNIFKEGELNKEMVCKLILHTTKHGFMPKKTQTKEVKYYNLNLIIAVGHRTKSPQSIAFRTWATERTNVYTQHLNTFLTQENTHMKKTSISDGRILIYRDKTNQIQVNTVLVDNDVWTNMAQFAELFQTARSNITTHINNIIKEGELNETSVCQIIRHTAADGKKYEVKFYNLKMAIALGFRINSVIATNFRKWANSHVERIMSNEHNSINAALGLHPQYFTTLLDLIKKVEEEAARVIDPKNHIFILFYTSLDFESYLNTDSVIFDRMGLRMQAMDKETQSELVKIFIEFARECARQQYVVYIKNWFEIFQCIVEMVHVPDLMIHIKLVCNSIIQRKFNDYGESQNLPPVPDIKLTNGSENNTAEQMRIINEILRVQK